MFKYCFVFNEGNLIAATPAHIKEIVSRLGVRVCVRAFTLPLKKSYDNQ